MNTNHAKTVLIAVLIDIAGNRTQNGLNSRLAYMYLDLFFYQIIHVIMEDNNYY